MIRKMTIATAISLLAVLVLTPSLSAAPRVFIHPYFGYGSYWYPGPWYYGPRVIVPAPVTGEIKLNTQDKDARVYVDGGYFGITRKVKKFDLLPGNHEIELRDARGEILFHERVTIVPGRTTELNAKGIAS